MRFTSLAVVGTLFSLCSASPTVSHVVHEKRASIPRGWKKRDAVSRDVVLPMRVGLMQSNLDKGHDWLMEISHPDSPKYGQHWTAQQIAEAFAPNDKSVKAVHSWLMSAGIAEERIAQSQGLSWLSFDATIDEAENLLNAKYHVYEHATTGQAHVACKEYSIPSDIQEHVDFVYPTIHFGAKLQPRREAFENEKRDDPVGKGKHNGLPRNGTRPRITKWLGSKPKKIWQELANCDNEIVPDCLRALYEFPPLSDANPNNSYGVVEYSPQVYIDSDLDIFFKNFSKVQVGSRPILNSIDGGNPNKNPEIFDSVESDLDFEYAMTLVYPQNVTLYQTGDDIESGSFNTFLDAIDASYCTFDGGDARSDPKYPDPTKGGYKGPLNCGGFAATKVISTSYAANEHDLPASYEIRQCHEYMKLGMMGVSVLYSSGDTGVAGEFFECINGTGTNAPYEPGADGGRFTPLFPGTCPYVTSVGATQVIPGTNISEALANGTQPEMACETSILSGGGFSNVFAMPSYQANAVQTFYREHPPPYGAHKYNNSQMVRGFPDVSANGLNYVVAVFGSFGLVSGTSASSPTFGSILTILNNARLNAGKSTVGFINPVAYANPHVFNDITEGSNAGCNTTGFEATTGWDPVTGLGTPNFPKMLKLWMSLP